MHTSLGVLIAGTVIGIYMQWTCVNSHSLSSTVSSLLVNDTEDCLCNSTGSLSPHCDNETSLCVCKPGYQGSNCTDCQNGYYHHSNRSTACIACRCDQAGSLDSRCDSNGTCQCKPGVGGTVCDMCLTGYYGMSVTGCQPCQYQETVTKCLQTSKKVDLKDASMCRRCLYNASWVKQSSDATSCHANEFLAANGSCVPCRCSRGSSLHNTNGSRLCDLMTGKCTECEGNSCSEGGESFNYEPYIIAGGVVAGITFVILSFVVAVYCRRRCRHKSRRTPLPLWTIELRRDEDAENHTDDAGLTPPDPAFSDIDVMYLDDSYLMESSDYFTESTDSLNRTGYHTLS